METKFKEVEKEIYELKVLLDGGYLNDNRRQKLKELESLMDYAHSCETVKEKHTHIIEFYAISEKAQEYVNRELEKILKTECKTYYFDGKNCIELKP